MNLFFLLTFAAYSKTWKTEKIRKTENTKKTYKTWKTEKTNNMQLIIIYNYGQGLGNLMQQAVYQNYHKYFSFEIFELAVCIYVYLV